MPQLPQPSTVSPGRLHLKYTTAGGINHECGVNLLADTDPGNAGEMEAEAESFAAGVKQMLLGNASITGWRISDLKGVTLYEEVFSPAIAGTIEYTSAWAVAESVSLTMTGKGVPDFGLKQGLARCVVFIGYFDIATMTGSRIPTNSGPHGSGLLTYLETSVKAGADRYGVKCDWRAYCDVQVNAHYQKRYGL